MKTIFALVLTLGCMTTLIAQDVIELTPSADCVVGFHDGYNSANENAGGASHFSSFWQPAAMGVGENGGYGLIQFDLSSIPEGSVINSATLSLKAFGDDFSPFLNEGHEGGNACWLQRITEEWEEYSATWNTQPGTTTTGQIDVPASTDPYENYNIDISTFIQDMVDDPANNFGFALKLQNEIPTRGLMFHSSDAADESDWPTLTIEYSAPTAISSTQPANFTFDVFPNPTTDQIMIKYPVQEQTSALGIYDLLGECLWYTDNYTANQPIDVTAFAPGMYTIRLWQNGQQAAAAETFIKQ